MHFLDEVLSQNMVHIDDIFLLRMHKLHWAFCPHVSLVDFLISFEQYIFFFPSYLFLVGFDKRVMPICKNIMGLGSWEFIEAF
jgi:hypothetical protein